MPLEVDQASRRDPLGRIQRGRAGGALSFATQMGALPPPFGHPRDIWAMWKMRRRARSPRKHTPRLPVGQDPRRRVSGRLACVRSSCGVSCDFDVCRGACHASPTLCGIFIRGCRRHLTIYLSLPEPRMSFGPNIGSCPVAHALASIPDHSLGELRSVVLFRFSGVPRVRSRRWRTPTGK